MPNWLASILIGLGVAWTALAYYQGTIQEETLGLHAFALLIALNCQTWRTDKKED